ncbi:protein 4.1 homolog [Helicoverpa armigera]|uniref:protein 4.1 homolog n=1 Tax=Helicoverpa armigera TaxID=29058 RepID=UPI003083003F
MRESLRRLASEDGTERRGRSAGSRRVRVELMLADHVTVDVDRKATGADLLDQICESLDLLEKDYFGLLYTQRGDPRVWVDLNRRLSKTFRNEPWDVRLAVKFYPPEPSELADDVTRYQMALAIRRDLMEGRLTCSPITYALLSSYVLQSELGDHEPSQDISRALQQYRALPLSAITHELEANVDELYRKHRGQTPAEAELNYLETAKRLSLYGAELHAATDCQDVPIVLAVCHSGIAVYRDGLPMNRFPWAKITKICYNKRLFTLRLRAGQFEEFETCLTFRVHCTSACKKLWRCSVEHHMFFRRECPVPVHRIPGLSRLGSRRLSCRRTLQQLRAAAAPTAA